MSKALSATTIIYDSASLNECQPRLGRRNSSQRKKNILQPHYCRQAGFSSVRR